MDRFADVTISSFGWSAQDPDIMLLLPEVTASIRTRAFERPAKSGLSKCQACGTLIGKNKSRTEFIWLNSFGRSKRCYLHAKGEECAKVEVWDCHQKAAYILAQVESFRSKSQLVNLLAQRPQGKEI
jgi:hypothetical protein